MNRTTPRLVGALVALLVAATLFSTPTSATAETRAAAQAPARPKVGSCHALTYQEAAGKSDPDAPVACDRRHTSRTFLVPTVPAGIRMDDMDALGRLVDRKCDPAYERTVSRSIRARLMSAYTYFWFAPTAAQVRQGARWVRCDVALVGGAVLAPLPTKVRRPALGKAPHRDTEARCYLGKKKGYGVTVCSRPHQYRAVKVFQGKGKSYPSERRLYTMARQGCRPAAGRAWATFNPSREQWEAGFRYFVCTRKTMR